MKPDNLKDPMPLSGDSRHYVSRCRVLPMFGHFYWYLSFR